MTAAAVEVEEIEHLDEEWATPCELRKPYGCGGDRAAEWIVHGSCSCPPPKVTLWCTPCKDLMLTVPGGIYCQHCGTLHVPASTAFKLIEALNGPRS